jgi:hypothetical protein
MLSIPISTDAISEAQVTSINIIKNRRLSSGDLDISYPSRMPFYLYGTPQEMHIDHVLLQAPNAQISAGEVAVELIEGSESVFTAGLKNGLIVVADTLPEHLMQPLTADCLSRFFHSGAKLNVSIYHDQNVVQPRGPSLCDNLGEPIARATISLGNNTFADAYMINLDTPKAMSQAPPEKSIAICQTLQDHPLFRGYGPEGPTADRRPSTKGWREMWDTAPASRRFAGYNLNSSASSTYSSTAPDTENDDHWPSPAPFTTLHLPFFASGPSK